jgi:hypothetical protein
MFVPILIVFVAMLLTATAHSQEEAAPAAPSGKDQAEESAKKIKDLRKERIAILREMTDVCAKLVKAARVPFEELLETRLQLCQEEVEAAETEAQRVVLYQNFVDALKEYEAWADDQQRAGRASVLPVLKIRAKIKHAEILLEQAKIKQAKAGK